MTNEKKSIPAWGIALIIVAALVPLVGFMGAIGIYGVRRYMVNAKSAEGRTNVAALAAGIAKCASSSASLPATSAAVPTSLASVSGVKYFATSAEWADPTLSCASFSLRDPQYFQYQWLLLEPKRGEARALADFDADGVPEQRFSMEVDCSTGLCALGPLVETPASASTPRAVTASPHTAGAPAASASTPSSGPPVLATILIALYLLVASVCGIWGTVIAFQESLMWGLLSLFVPCAHFVFVIKFWDRAKKPFLIQLAALPLLFVGTVAAVMSEESAKNAPPVAVVDDRAEK